MNIQEKISLIKQVGEEIIGERELFDLFKSESNLIAYDGFEPSGQIHIAQGLMRAINVNKMIKAGVRFKMLVADWHAMANNKLGGDLKKIQTVGKYFIEVWRACGMNLSQVEFIWASDLVKDSKYWELVIKIGRTNALRRFIRTAEIMGREESLDKLTGAMIIYSCMQVADIFFLGAKICQLGMDQRKVNVLAREIGPILGFWKPVVVSHHMLLGLNVKSNIANITYVNKLKKTIELKMSKSHPDSAIFMTDSYEEIKRKISKAFCPERVVDFNPILEYYRYIIFEAKDRLEQEEIVIKRLLKFGGNMRFKDYSELEKKYLNGELHPLDLKINLVDYLERLISPVRQYFQNNNYAQQLLNQVTSYQVTR